MSQLLWIGSSDHTDFIREKLALESKLLLGEGVVLEIHEQKIGPYTFFGLNVPTDLKGIPLGEGTIFSLRYSVAKILTELVMLRFERQLLQDLIKTHCYYCTREERALILEKALDVLAESFPQRRRKAVLQLIFDYLETERLLNLEGFIRFRLGSYLQELRDAVEKAIDDYLMEKEYQDFVRLLKYFVDMQEPKTDSVNVLIQPDGFFQLYDSSDNMIKSDRWESLVADLAEQELGYEDLLISILVTLAPRRIILHLPDPGDVMNTVHTIQNIFEQRVSICCGCAKCANHRQHKKKP